jgi:hypothetical protein
MNTIFERQQDLPKVLKKILGYTALAALVLQFFVPGFYAPSTVSAQAATTTSLTVTKVVVGGDAVVSDFPLFVDGLPVLSGVATTTFSEGAHVVTETNLPGYTATFSGDCAADGTVTLAAGVDAECTITNTFAALPAPTVDIDINGSDGPVTITDGEEWSYSWTSADATACEITSPSGVSGVALSGSGGPIGTAHVWYPDVGDSTTLTLDCTNGIDSVSDSVTISVVAALPTATTSLTVTKVVDGGDMAAGDFDLFVNATPVTSGVPLVFASTSIPTAPLTVSETPVAGYTASFSGDCAADGTITLTPGVESECIMTNTFEAPAATTTSFTLTKVVVGGDAVASDFPLFVNGMSITSGVATTTLAAGAYAITETNLPGYTATFSGDCAADGTVTLTLGDDLECTITNTFGAISATSTSLTVTKVVEGGGDLEASDFPLFVNGMSVTSGVATTTLAAGTYFISEISNSDYDASFSGDCAANGTVTISAGVAANCVITNTFDPGDEGGGGFSSGRFNPDVNVNVENGDVNAGDVNVDLGTLGTTGSFPFPVTFPGQVLGASSVVPVYTPVNSMPGQVLGAQSYVPGLPTTGAEPLSQRLPRLGLLALAGFLGIAGAGLILAPRSLSQSRDMNQEDL